MFYLSGISTAMFYSSINPSLFQINGLPSTNRLKIKIHYYLIFELIESDQAFEKYLSQYAITQKETLRNKTTSMKQTLFLIYIAPL